MIIKWGADIFFLKSGTYRTSLNSTILLLNFNKTIPFPFIGYVTLTVVSTDNFSPMGKKILNYFLLQKCEAAVSKTSTRIYTRKKCLS